MPPGFKPIQITVFPVQSSVSTTSGHALLSLVRQSSSHAKTTSPCLHLCIGNVGDTIVVTLNNKLGNETTSLHWHGLYQAGSNANDGPPMVTQCPILPGQSYTYTFRVSSSVTVTRMILTTSPKVGQPGTYWYHSHSPGQYADGLRGPLIIHDPKAPFAGKYDGELVLSLADWYHSQTPVLIPQYLDPTINPEGGEPVPYSALMNEQMGAQFPVVPGKTYLVRVINMVCPLIIAHKQPTS